ncbi:hypothetical protein BC830DRAFT_194662 [Chytriomyces sp. MP71]|nr:hypothetical protein BC830DRAFT_194662 [Chytriomyces sp. MP71]
MEVDVLPVVASATSELASASASVDPRVAPALIVGPRTGAGPLKMPSAPIAKLLAPPKPPAAKAAASKVFIAHASATGKAATPTLVTTASGATPTLIAPRLGSTPNLVGPSRAAASSSQSLGSDAAKRVDSKYPQFKKAPVKQAPAAPPKPAQVDVFDLMDSLKEKEKREEAAKRERREREDAARRERDREERRVAEQQRGGADLRQLASTGRPRDTSSYHTRDSPRDARSPPVVQSPLDSVPSPAQRAKEYASSIEVSLARLTPLVSHLFFRTFGLMSHGVQAEICWQVGRFASTGNGHDRV